MTGATSYHAGLSAERIVAALYAERGCPLLAERWRGEAGEIDLILADGEGLIFVEVKKAADFARAAERVSPAQARRIYAAAAEYLGRMPKGELTESRFDVALVDVHGRVEILENAFGL